MKTTGWLLLACFLAAAPVQARPAAVDLSRWQTPVKNQWHRGNCFIHATVAAMEAAYLRAGHGELDLSELFSDYMGQLFFLETVEMNDRWYTTTMRVPAATERETSIQSDHAMSVESAEPCQRLAIPEERFMPYRPLPQDLGEHGDKNDPFWANQFTVSAFNLDPAHLPYSALSAPRYYQIRSVEWLPKADARDPAAIEAVLAGGHEVIWDFRMAGDISGRVWINNGPAGDSYPHRMLIIGYNRSDPHNRYFLVKNSWGDVGVYDTNDCLTRIAYEFLEYGEWASYIKEVAPPRPWPELQFIGRWRLDAEALSGILDLYHLPGMMQKGFAHCDFRDEAGRPLQDRRLGTFYAQGDPLQAFRVNGSVRGGAIELYVDFQNPAARWDRLQGWKFTLAVDPRDPHRLVGRFATPDGRRGTAQAKRNQDPISPLAPAPAPTEPIASAPVTTEPEPPAPPEDPDLKRKAEEDLKLAASERAEKEAAAAADSSPILRYWSELGGKDSFLGPPETAEATCPDGRGRYVHFAGGSIYWTPETGAHVVCGAIRELWAALGWETCEFLGYPVTDETATPDGIGRYNHFEKGGSIYWTPDHGAVEIHGPIRAEWERQGWEAGPLGYPVSGVQFSEDKSGLFTRFQRGTIRWDPARGAYTELDK